MTSLFAQGPTSLDRPTGEGQLPAPARQPRTSREATVAARTAPSPLGQDAAQPTSERQRLGADTTAGTVEVEEYFEGVVEEIADDALRLRTLSSEGEEAVAWLPVASIPPGERRYIALGSLMRVTVVVRAKPTGKTKRLTRVRETDIRFLRPEQQLRPGPALREEMADLLLKRMLATLSAEG